MTFQTEHYGGPRRVRPLSDILVIVVELIILINLLVCLGAGLFLGWQILSLYRSDWRERELDIAGKRTLQNQRLTPADFGLEPWSEARSTRELLAGRTPLVPPDHNERSENLEQGCRKLCR